MLHIILLLLKIAGCILLAIIGLMILCVLLILFVPLHYQANGSRFTHLKVEGRISWLLRLLELMVTYQSECANGLHIVLRIGPVTVYDNQQPKEQKAKAKKEKADTVVQSDKTLVDTNDTQSEQTALPIAAIEEKSTADTQTMTDTGYSSETAHTSFFEKLYGHMQRLFAKVIHFFSTVMHIPSKIGHLIEKISHKKEEVLSIYEDESNYQWIHQTFDRFKKVLFRMLPHFDHLYLHFGFDDPALTGQMLGGLSMLYPLCGNAMQLEPEFDKALLEGAFSLRGHIQIVGIVFFGIQNFLNKRFFRLFKQIKSII